MTGRGATVGTVEVQTASGMLRGSHDGDLLRFRGVRYARAARFANPEPEAPWEGVRDALVEGPMCPQPPFGLALLALPKPALPMGEDCLFLNVTAPAKALASASASASATASASASPEPLPVMVWIHGGAYVNGSGGGGIYDASRLARGGDTIVVGINYRLGVFGFVPLPGVAEANLGIRDQLAALQWVHDNIAAFGGDPDRVTVFGQSAGADSIVELLAIPEADHLFSRVILQSPPLGLNVGREALAGQLGGRVVQALGRTNPLEASVEQLLSAQVSAGVGLTGDRLTAGMPYAPTPGVWPVAQASEKTGRLARRAAGLEVVIGYDRDDFTPFLDAVPVLRRARSSSLLKPLTEPVSRELTRRVFGGPALALARLLGGNGARVYTYRFDWRPKGTPWGACHCIELPFFWADEEFWRGSPMLAGVRWDDLEAYGVHLRRQWLAFARGEAPAPDWPLFSPNTQIGRRFTFEPHYGV